MKRSLATFAFLAVLVCAVHAREKNLEREMEYYARDFFRAHPKAAGDDKARDAAEKLVNDAKDNKLLEISKDDAKKLRKRELTMGKRTYATALAELKSLNSKDPKITFLVKYAENPKIKADEQLLAYRLIQHHYQKAAADAAFERSKRIATILAKYTAYKEGHDGKAPASLSDLELPADCKKFINSKGDEVDYIYIGHLGPRLKTNNSHIVLIEPEPLGDARVCGLDDGNVVNYNNSAIQEHIDKIVKSMNDGTVAHGGGATPPGTAANLNGFMKKYKIFKELNNNKEPSTIDELNLADKDKKYTDPDTGEKFDWIFLGSSSRIRAGDGVVVIVVAPKPHKGGRLAGLSNGKVVIIQDAQISPLLNQ